MLVIDPLEGTIVDANAAAVKFYGWSREELLGKSLGEINTLAPEMLREQMRKAKSRKRNIFIFRHRLANGKIRDVETYSGPVSMQEGKSFLLSIVHDISDRLAAERERDRLMEKMEHYLSSSPTIIYSLHWRAGAPVCTG